VALSVTDVPGIISAVHVAAKAGQTDQLEVELNRLERALGSATRRVINNTVVRLDRIVDRNGIDEAAKELMLTYKDKLKPVAPPGQGGGKPITRRRLRLKA